MSALRALSLTWDSRANNNKIKAIVELIYEGELAYTR